MSVKRYSVGVDGVDPNGNLVKYTDYAALERKLVESQRDFRAADATIENLQMQVEKLAAENAGLKDINAWCKTDAFKNMYREFKTAEALGCHDVDCMHDAMLTAIMHAPKTPATDAFLAEVRAAAVDEVCLKISNAIINCYQDEQIGLDEAATICGDFAAQIRKERR